MKFILTVFLFIFSLTSCQYFNQLIGFTPVQPDFELTKIKLVQLGNDQMIVDLIFQVRNSNIVDLSVSSWNYKILFQNEIIVSGDVVEKKTIPSESSTLVTVPTTVHLKNAQQVFLQANLLHQKSVGFDVKSEATFYAGYVPFKIDYQKNFTFKDLVR